MVLGIRAKKGLYLGLLKLCFSTENICFYISFIGKLQDELYILLIKRDWTLPVRKKLGFFHTFIRGLCTKATNENSEV